MTPQEISNAWDSWIASETGEKCLQPGAVGEYLRNRLWWAYLAGVDAGLRTNEALVSALHRIASNDGRGGPRPNPDSDPLRQIASEAIRAWERRQ